VFKGIELATFKRCVRCAHLRVFVVHNLGWPVNNLYIKNIYELRLDFGGV
jgi:hypothetical protein